MKLRVELRAGEGGTDAELLVDNMLEMYAKFCKLQGL